MPLDKILDNIVLRVVKCPINVLFLADVSTLIVGFIHVDMCVLLCSLGCNTKLHECILLLPLMDVPVSISQTALHEHF